MYKREIYLGVREKRRDVRILIKQDLDPAWGGDDNVRPFHQILGLAQHVHPSHYHSTPQVQARPQCPELLCQLISQFPNTQSFKKTYTYNFKCKTKKKNEYDNQTWWEL